MAQANAEYRLACPRLEDGSKIFDRRFAFARVAWAVAEEQAVVIGLVQVPVPWHDVHASTPANQAPQLIVL